MTKTKDGYPLKRWQKYYEVIRMNDEPSTWFCRIVYDGTQEGLLYKELDNASRAAANWINGGWKRKQVTK